MQHAAAQWLAHGQFLDAVRHDVIVKSSHGIFLVLESWKLDGSPFILILACGNKQWRCLAAMVAGIVAFGAKTYVFGRMSRQVRCQKHGGSHGLGHVLGVLLVGYAPRRVVWFILYEIGPAVFSWYGLVGLLREFPDTFLVVSLYVFGRVERTYYIVQQRDVLEKFVVWFFFNR